MLQTYGQKLVSYLAENIDQSSIDSSLSGHYTVSWVLKTKIMCH